MRVFLERDIVSTSLGLSRASSMSSFVHALADVGSEKETLWMIDALSRMKLNLSQKEKLYLITGDLICVQLEAIERVIFTGSRNLIAFLRKSSDFWNLFFSDFTRQMSSWQEFEMERRISRDCFPFKKCLLFYRIWWLTWFFSAFANQGLTCTNSVWRISKKLQFIFCNYCIQRRWRN